MKKRKNKKQKKRQNKLNKPNKKTRTEVDPHNFVTEWQIFEK